MNAIVPLSIRFTGNLDLEADHVNYEDDGDYRDDVDESNDGNEGHFDRGDYGGYCA